MHPLAKRRCLAYLTDCLPYLGIAAATAPVGVVLATTTELGASRLYSHLISAVPPAIATVVTARAESGPHRATWGKRRQGLTVLTVDGAPLSGGRALARSVVKVFVPWQLGHLTAVGAAWGRLRGRRRPHLRGIDRGLPRDRRVRLDESAGQRARGARPAGA